MERSRIAILAAACVLVVASIACGAISAGTKDSAPSAALAPTDQPASAEQNAPTVAPEPAPTEDPCILWDEVTTDMKGEQICFRGIITKFDQSRQLGTRYSFSDKAGAVFIYSVKYEITDSNTGKTIAPGTCVEIAGPVRVEGERPAVYLDPIMEDDSGDSGYFYFYEDSSSCQ